jgi:hypothetical protein
VVVGRRWEGGWEVGGVLLGAGGSAALARA